MTGSPGTLPAPDLPPGPRAALVVATASYQDPGLSQLRATADDAQTLTDVLGDPGIGGFTVTSVIDADERQVRRSIGVFLSGRGTGDVVLVYLSCHGVLDRRNRLYFAAADTVKDQLSSTGIPAAWLLEQLEECRARQQVVILDCCFSGAFAKGSKGDGELDLERRISGSGRGRAVLTASRSGEYSFTGDALHGSTVSGSVFTAGLVAGLRTGAADTGGDGYISVDEAYDFTYRYVLSLDTAQTPQRWLSGGEGAIVLARSPAGIAIKPAPLPEELADALESRYPTIRIGAVHELGAWIASDDLGRALTAEQKLRQIADNDNHTVANAARSYLTTPSQATKLTSPSDGSAKDEISTSASLGKLLEPLPRAQDDTAQTPADTESIAQPNANYGVLRSQDGLILAMDRPYVFGREPTNDSSVRAGDASPVELHDSLSQISRVHAYVSIRNGTPFVRDVSSHGTYVRAPENNKWTHVGLDGTPLPPGWALRIGQHIFVAMPSESLGDETGQ